MSRIALVTCQTLPQLTDSEQKLLPLLADLGIQAEPRVWNDIQVDWSNYDGIIIRSVWDYHLQYSFFLAWLVHLENLAIPVWNPVEVLRENSHKFYLQTLAEAGLHTIPTLCLTRSQNPDWEKIKAQPWPQVVIKPAISAGAMDTRILSRDQLEQADSPLRSLLAKTDVLIQPYTEAVAEQGEWSLIFFNGNYSHAVLKQPKTGDFRVQEEHGGRSVSQSPPPHVIEEARAFVQFYQNRLLYARVDGVVLNEKFHLMELELVEPELFLMHHPQAHQSFAEAIAARCS